MKNSLRKLTNAVMLVGLGVALYYAGPVIHELAVGAGDQPRLEAAPVLADSPKETAGNAYLFNSLVTLEKRRSVTAKTTQYGVIEGRVVSATGDYHQTGSGRSRKFSLELKGKVTDDPIVLRQVSDSRFLWTDMKWGAVDEDGLRQVWRVDLRRVQNRLAQETSDPAQPGQAAVEAFHPRLWAGLGGLPMLLESLEANFDFEQPFQMELRGQPVFATVGFWKEDRRQALLAKRDGAPATTALPSRMPHHVLVVIGAADLFPYRVEYRGPDDPLSAASLPSERRYGSSQRPLLQLNFMQPRFDASPQPDTFVYKPPADVVWMDRTNQRLKVLEKRRVAEIARTTHEHRRE